MIIKLLFLLLAFANLSALTLENQFHGHPLYNIKKIKIGMKKKHVQEKLGKGLIMHGIRNVLYYFYSHKKNGILKNTKIKETILRMEFNNNHALIKIEEVPYNCYKHTIINKQDIN